jgi:hypothetical protein
MDSNQLIVEKLQTVSIVRWNDSLIDPHENQTIDQITIERGRGLVLDMGNMNTVIVIQIPNNSNIRMREINKQKIVGAMTSEHPSELSQRDEARVVDIHQTK